MIVSARRGEAFPASIYGFATSLGPVEPLITTLITGMPRPYTRHPARPPTPPTTQTHPAGAPRHRHIPAPARRGEAVLTSICGFATSLGPVEPLVTTLITGLPRPYTRHRTTAGPTNSTNPSRRDRHHRRSIRLCGYDYTQSGAYFVTVCTDQRRSLFGRVVDGEMHLNPLGRIVVTYWHRLIGQADDLDLAAFIVMPNHVHTILVLTRVAETVDGNAPRLPRLPSRSLGAIVGNLKSVVTRRINQVRNTPGARVWQRNYYEHIVRDDSELARIRTYIAENPAHWLQDCYYEVGVTRLREE